MKVKKNPSSDSTKLVTLEAQINELQDKLARSLADYANLEKRIDAQRQMFITLATVSIISKMIAVLDDLYLANDHIKDAGLQMTVTKFLDVLKSEGLEEINPLNQKFDPATMECITVAEGEEDQVLQVQKKGYLLNGQVIRPAQVIVGKKLLN